jgi:hypothetical protein
MARRWDNPFTSGTGGSFDPGTIYGLILRSQRGDLAAKHHLAQNGFYDQYGNDIYDAAGVRGGNYQKAVNDWATAKGLSQYSGPDAFQWNQTYATGNPGFQSAWDAWYQQDQKASGYPGGDKPLVAGQDYQPNSTVAQPAGGQQTAQGYRVNTPSAYGKPNAYYYNGHATQGDQGQWIQLPVAYNAAQDTRKFEYNGTPQESAVRRAIRYAFDDMQKGAKDFNAALLARLKQFHDEAGGVGVGYSMTGTPGTTPPVTPPGTQPGTTPPVTPPGTTPPGTDPATQQQSYTNPVTGQVSTGSGGQFFRDIALASDPDARNDYLLRQLGMDPNQGGLYLDSIMRVLDPIGTRFTQLQGIGGGGGGPMVNTQGNLDQLAGWLRNPGGLQNVQNWASQQMQGAVGQGSMLRNLSDVTAQQNTLGQLMALEKTGMNPILLQAYADYYDQGKRGYRDYNFNQLGQGAVQNPIDWLLASQWADLLR